MSLVSNLPIYRDFYLRLIISFISGNLIVSFGEKESFFELLLIRGYWVSVAASAVIAFILVSLVRWLTMRLDRNYDWIANPVQRIGLQLLLVMITPAIAAFLLATLYFWPWGINILHTDYLRYDFPVIVLMLVLINVYYIAYYFYLRATTNTVKNKEGQTDTEITATEQMGKDVFLVSQGTKNILLSTKEISYFYRRAGVNRVRCFDKEDYSIADSLDEVQQQLDPSLYFRANRQLLVNFNACDHFELLAYGKLQLFLHPGYHEPVIISQKRSKLFKDWLNR